MIRLLTCSGLLLVLGYSGYTASYIMGADSRVELSQEEASITSIRQIGIIDTGDGGFVNGVVTGANCDVVISAGHAAFYWEDNLLLDRVKGARRGNSTILFYPEPQLSSEGTPLTLIASAYEDLEKVGDDKHDWSIFRLPAPAYDQCDLLEIKRSTTSCPGSILFPAYHFDRKRSKLIDNTCSIKDSLGKEIIVHDCDTKDGSSGAPLICESEGRYSLIGINISGLSLKDANNPSIFGNPGEAFNIKTHKNFAITFHGEFYMSLTRELIASESRKNHRH
jgi:hypothetical protein